MPEYIVELEPLLKVGQYVLFSKGWREEVRNKVFEVLAAQQIPRSIYAIISSGGTYSISLKARGFVPESPESLYEILFKFRGTNLILYPKFPSTDYYLKLEKSGYSPNPSDPDLRYLGGFTEEDFERGRLREYTVYINWQPEIVYDIYNDSPADEHFRLDAIVNRVKLTDVSPDVQKKVIESGRYRFITHYEAVRW